MFLGSQRETLPHEPHEVSRIMLFPQYLIIGVMLSVAFVPQWYLAIVGNLLSGMALISHPTFPCSPVLFPGCLFKYIESHQFIFFALYCCNWSLLDDPSLRSKEQVHCRGKYLGM